MRQKRQKKQGRTSNKEKSETEHLKGIIRELKSENRNLRKRIKELQRRESHFEEIVDEVVEEVEMKETCRHCGKGEIQELDFKFVIIKKCLLCGETERIKPNGKKTEKS